LFQQHRLYGVEWDGQVIMNEEYVGNYEDSAVAYLKVLPQYSSGKIENPRKTVRTTVDPPKFEVVILTIYS